MSLCVECHRQRTMRPISLATRSGASREIAAHRSTSLPMFSDWEEGGVCVIALASYNFRLDLLFFFRTQGAQESLNDTWVKLLPRFLLDQCERFLR